LTQTGPFVVGYRPAEAERAKGQDGGVEAAQDAAEEGEHAVQEGLPLGGSEVVGHDQQAGEEGRHGLVGFEHDGGAGA
jgi:hypothetical protein